MVLVKGSGSSLVMVVITSVVSVASVVSVVSVASVVSVTSVVSVASVVDKNVEGSLVILWIKSCSRGKQPTKFAQRSSPAL